MPRAVLSAEPITANLITTNVLNLVQGVLVLFLFKLAGAVVIWLVANSLIRLGLRVLRRTFVRSRLDATLISYLINIAGALLRVVLVVAILGFFGVQTASFAALLAGAGVAIGAAWSGLLGDFAAGVFLQLFRPFNVGDQVRAAGVLGVVEEIDMFATTLTSGDNVRCIVPNGKIFSDVIENYSAYPYRRVDLFAQLDHRAGVARAILLLREGLRGVPHQYPGMEGTVDLLEINDRGPRLAVRPYAIASQYLQVVFSTNRMIADVLQRHGIPVPHLPVMADPPAA
ncbi:MAG: mechanosensitive ion channel family protein [Cyanobacteriota bacterium]